MKAVLSLVLCVVAFSVVSAQSCTSPNVGQYPYCAPQASYGYYYDGSSLVLCSAGNYCPYGSTSQITCPAGMYCPSNGMSYPYICPGGTFNAYTGISTSSYCLTCDKGYYCRNVPVACTDGYCFYQQAACLANVVCVTGATSEIACSTGTSSIEGQAYCNVLSNNYGLASNGSTPTVSSIGSYLASGAYDNSAVYLYMQNDGNVCLYDGTDPIKYPPVTGMAAWCLGTGNALSPNPSGYQAVMQSDGNFCVYAIGNPTALWCSSTSNLNGYQYYLQVGQVNKLVCVMAPVFTTFWTAQSVWQSDGATGTSCT